MGGIKIPKHKKMSLGELQTFQKPKYIYVPIADHDITVLVKKGDYVLKGDIIAHRKGNKIPYFSSVSGTVIDTVEKTNNLGNKTKCLQIENDYKEKTAKRNSVKGKINEYTKQEFITLLRDSGIVGMGGAGFPTYLKYQTETPIQTLLINAVECEPYITADYTLMLKHAEEILEAIDAIIEINEIPEAKIVIKKDNIKGLHAFETFIGTYPKIHLILVPNRYPMGWERYVVQRACHVHYQKLPIEKGIVVNNVSTIYAIYETLKFQKPLLERIVTFTGIGFEHPMNVLLKTGTPVREVIDSLIGEKKLEKVVSLAGGPMMGNTVQFDDLIVTPTLNCVLAIVRGEFGESLPCSHCGKCVQVCPSFLSPVLIKENIGDEKLSSLHPERCIECGLCSYVCPSKIEVREYVKTAKKGDNA